jgi:hypothetical protein
MINEYINKHGKVKMSEFLNILLHEHLHETPTISRTIFFCSKKPELHLESFPKILSYTSSETERWQNMS